LIIVTLDTPMEGIPPTSLLYHNLPTLDAIAAAFKTGFNRIIEGLTKDGVTNDQAQTAALFRDSIDQVLSRKPAYADEAVVVFDGGDYVISIMGQETEDDPLPPVVVP
jgi:hypothetical protein